ncbi:MAG: hypothetical protein ACXACY_30725 [Candidatus Hodarchaeales archaeon]|jgi:hypothetical protein
MALIDDLKKKIELSTDFVGGQGVRYNDNTLDFSIEEYEIYFDGELNGEFQVTKSGIQGDTQALSDPNIKGDYKVGFESFAKQSIKRKDGKNLNYGEIRYLLTRLSDDSDLKEIINKSLENIDQAELGVLYDEYRFNNFDFDVTNKVNETIKRGGTISLIKLPNFTTTQTSADGTLNKYVLVNPWGAGTALNDVDLKPDRFDEIATAYAAENGSFIEQTTSDVKLDPSLQLAGNVSEINEEFSYDENRATSLLELVQNLFIDYKTPSGILNTNYKSFLINTFSNTPNSIPSLYQAQVDSASSDIIFYLLYDFEYSRRVSLAEQINILGPDASVEDILNAAEAAALDDLADSGLAGEGGVTLQQAVVDPEDAQRFYEQCLLIANMNDLKKHFNNRLKEEFLNSDEEDEGKEKMHQPSPYQGRFYMVEAPEGNCDYSKFSVKKTKMLSKLSLFSRIPLVQIQN